MKKLFIQLALVAVVVGLMTGCAGISPITGGATGLVYSQVNNAVAVGPAAGWSKVGTATSKAIICVAMGDSSIAAAMKNGGITKINHVDCKVTSVLGIYAEYTTVVYGE